MDEDPEGYAITTSHLPDTSLTEQDCPTCSSPWLWIILFVLFLLLSIGFLIWIIFLYRREDRNCSGCTGPGVPITVEGARINVDSSTQISATWTTTDPNDVVTLFATLHPPVFSSDGSLSNSTAQTLHRVAGAAAVGPTGITGATGATGTANSVILPGLTPGLKYYATLIARNRNTHNYKSYTQIVYMEAGIINTFTNGPTGTILNTFEIQDILQVGAIQLTSDVADANGIYTVQFNQRPRQARDLFYFNGSSQLQLSPANAAGLEGLCLFNNGGNLVAAGCTGGIIGATGGSVPNTSYFVYNPLNNANKLCLKNTIDGGTPTCLKLTGISNGIGTVSFSNQTGPGDSFALAFENGQ